jgi:hypothetical protein
MTWAHAALRAPPAARGRRGYGPPHQRSAAGGPIVLHAGLVSRPVPHRPAARRRGICTLVTRPNSSPLRPPLYAWALVKELRISKPAAKPARHLGIRSGKRRHARRIGDVQAVAGTSQAQPSGPSHCTGRRPLNEGSGRRPRLIPAARTGAGTTPTGSQATPRNAPPRSPAASKAAHQRRIADPLLSPTLAV